MTQKNAVIGDKPFFYDVTLRDGNQSLQKPWDQEQKLKVFNLLLRLEIKGIEAGFPSASESDFESVAKIAELAPEGVIIGALSRSCEKDILQAGKALNFSKKAIPRIHTFIGMSPYHMKNVLASKPDDVLKKAVAAVKLARSLVGESGQVQFSPEHFGDCEENIDWVIDGLFAIVEAGANVINLPNTVERKRPTHFTGLVSKVVGALPNNVIVSVHCHNDLGMATATTVESYFAGAKQLEVVLNGLGERAGNASFYETAVALVCNGVAVESHLEFIYETALEIAELSNIPIPKKSPLIGSDVFTHRSGVHQHAAGKTRHMGKGAYRPIDLKIVGRLNDEACEFTPQSGKSAVAQIIRESGHSVTESEAKILLPALKTAAENLGVLNALELLAVYKEYKNLVSKKKNIVGADLTVMAKDVIENSRQLVWEVEDFQIMTGKNMTPTAIVKLRKDSVYEAVGTGDGPIDAAFTAIQKIVGMTPTLEHYTVVNVTAGIDSQSQACVILSLNKKKRDGHYADTDTVSASIKAYVSAINKLIVS